MSDLEGAGDAFVLEKYYYRKCLRSAQRSFTPLDYCNDQFIRNLCDERLLLSVENTHTHDEDTVSLAGNDVYLSIFKKYQEEVDDTANYRKSDHY